MHERAPVYDVGRTIATLDPYSKRIQKAAIFEGLPPEELDLSVKPSISEAGAERSVCIPPKGTSEQYLFACVWPCAAA